MTAIYGLVIFFALFLLYGFLSNFCLTTRKYEIVSERISSGCRLVMLADLHGCEHGKGNSRLKAEIQECAPDVICIVGDLIVKNGGGIRQMLDFLVWLSKRYTVLYAPGNHEIRMPDYDSYREKVRDMGVVFLENQSYVWNNRVVFAGLDLPEYWYHKFYERREMTREVIRRYMGDCDTEKMTVLLAHNPEYFLSYAGWGADLTLCGHVHGGIMRLPFVGGVIAPSLQLFPKYDAGEFEMGDKKMIVSRGLGLHHIKFRFFNCPELSVIDLKS